MNVFKETFDKSSLRRKNVVTESKKVTESINEEAKAEIADIVAMEFESGHITFDNFEDFKLNPDMLDTSKEAWEYYLELRNLGPVGFYEVYKDVFDFSPDFVAEYGSDEVSENEYEDESEDIVEPKRNINVDLARKYCSTGPTGIFNYMITVKKNGVEDIRYIQCFCKEQAEEYLRRTEPDLEIIDFENVGSYTLTMQGIHPVDLVSVKESKDASVDKMQESTNARWVQVDLNAEDDYKYSGNGGRSWVTKDSEYVDTWPTKEDAIENGMKTFRKGRKLGRDWDVVRLESKLPEDNSNRTADSLKWEERSATRRVASWQEGIYYVELEEHISPIDGDHYYVYIEATDVNDMIINGREFGSVNAALSYINAITAYPQLLESQTSSEQEQGKFANTLEDKITRAFPGCQYEEILENFGTAHIYVTLFGHTYEVVFNVASQESDIEELGAEAAADVYAEEAIQNIKNQIVSVANEPGKMPDFNKGNAATFLDELEDKLKASLKTYMMRPEIGFLEDEVEEYTTVSANIVGDHIEIHVGAELSYEPLENLCIELNKVITEYDANAYFEPECPGRIVAYLF